MLAFTPVAALMFRFNNPDAMLALLMVVTVSCVLRALEDARTKWLVLAGAVLGLAFLTKTLQAWLIVPPLALVHGVCAPTALRRRLLQLLYATVAMVLAGGWWVAIVQLWPASSRPYIGGSQDNSFLSLTFGYNGFGRITGNETGSVGGGGGPGGGAGMWGTTGIGRLFGSDMGGQIAWLLPAAFVLLAAGLWITRRARRTSVTRSAFLVWGGCLLITFVTFSFMSGIFHQYYNVALAPYIAALIGMGTTLLWRRRTHIAAAVVLAGTVAGTSVWAYALLNRSSGWHPWLRTVLVVAGVVSALGLLAGALPGHDGGTDRRPAGRAVRGGRPRRGPRRTGRVLTGDGRYGARGVDRDGRARGAGRGRRAGRPGGGFGGPGAQGGPGGRAGQGGGGQAQLRGNGTPPTAGGGTSRLPGQGGSSRGLPGGGGTGGAGAPGGGGGMGGLLDGARVGSAMKALLLKDADAYTWVAAAIGSQNQASYQLATGKPVMSIGGFNGSDPSPTLAQFEKDVSAGRVHYFIGSGGGGGGGLGGPGMGGSNASSAISTWVTAHFTARTVGGVTVYDLTNPK